MATVGGKVATVNYLRQWIFFSSEGHKLESLDNRNVRGLKVDEWKRDMMLTAATAAGAGRAAEISETQKCIEFGGN